MTDTPYNLAAAELRGIKLDPLEIESVLRRRAYGHLCAGLASLFSAASFYVELDGPKGDAIMRAAKKLAELAPDYSTVEQKLFEEKACVGHEVQTELSPFAG